MTQDWSWVLLDTALIAHERSLELFGGAGGLRDRGRLEAAIERPKLIATYEEGDLCRLAAAYGHGIATGHPFVDGNKRTAFIVLDVFLRRNGWILVAGSEDKIAKMTQLAAGEMDEAAFADWLRSNTISQATEK